MREHKSLRSPRSLSRGYYLGHDAFMCRQEIYREDANIDKAVKLRNSKEGSIKTSRHSNSMTDNSNNTTIVLREHNERWVSALHVFSELNLPSVKTQNEFFRKHQARSLFWLQIKHKNLNVFANKKILLRSREMNHRKAEAQIDFVIFKSRVFTNNLFLKNNLHLPKRKKFIKITQKASFGSSRQPSLTNSIVNRDKKRFFRQPDVISDFCIALDHEKSRRLELLHHFNKFHPLKTATSILNAKARLDVRSSKTTTARRTIMLM